MGKENNDLRDLIILLPYFCGDKIYGRTFLQKFFFLIKKELKPDLEINYSKYHYGLLARC
jgi:hypothetical protein